MTLRELQLYKFGILDDIASICDKHNIQYVLHYGTLLGAVRHNGFIPWDDDIDIAVPWNDYFKLINVLKQKEYSKKYFPQNIWTEPKFPLTWTQIRVNGTTNMPAAYYEHDIHWGMCIDVFPLVAAYDDMKLQENTRKAIHAVDSLLAKEFMDMTKTRTTDKYQMMINFIPRRTRHMIARSILKKYAHNPVENGFVSPLCDLKKIYPYSDILVTEKHVFEGKMFSIPKGYHNVLTIEYGDYMKLPPVEERCGHEKALGLTISDINKDYTEYQTELRAKSACGQ